MSGPTEFDPYQKWLGIPQASNRRTITACSDWNASRRIARLSSSTSTNGCCSLSKHKEGPFAKVCKSSSIRSALRRPVC